MHSLSNRFRSPLSCSRFGGLGILAVMLLPISGCSSPDPEAQKAVEQAKHIMQDLKDGHSQAIWECWTDAQRKDVNQIVHKFAKKAPPELWKNLFELFGLWGNVLKEKREFALHCPHLKKGHANLKEHGEVLANFLTALAKSDARDLEKLEKANVGDLFKQLDPEMMRAAPAVFHLSPNEAEQRMALETWQHGLATFADGTVSVRESGEGWAELEFSADTQVSRMRFIKMDGRWVPKISTESEWNENMRQADKWLAEFDPAQIPQINYVNVLAAVAISRLQQALKTETQAEFDALFENGPDPILPYFFFAAEKKIPIPQ